MFKIFTTNKDGKIELTKEELKELLDASYCEVYRAQNLTYVAFSNDTSNTVNANEVR
jgi:DNA polymerase III sliding clamp (beta) subunit (PCNA family)